MRHKRTIDRLVTPSYFSTSLAFIFTIYVFVINIWPTVKSYPIVSQVSSVFVDREEIVNSNDSAVQSIRESFFSSSTMNNIVYLLAWAFIGVLVYFLFIIFSKGLSDFKDTISISRAVNIDRTSVVKDLSIKILLRVSIAFAFIIFIGFFTRVLFPVASASVKAGSSAVSFEDWKYLSMAFLIVVLSIHILTIFMRLLLLRVRVFGGSDELVLSQ